MLRGEHDRSSLIKSELECIVSEELSQEIELLLCGILGIDVNFQARVSSFLAPSSVL